MQRDFKGIWIPKELWLLRDLSLLEKVMLIEIDSLDNESGCYATNDYFAEFFGLSKGRISKIINNLVRKGFIASELKYQKGTQLVEKRILKISRWYGAKNGMPPSQKQLGGMAENDQGYGQKRLQGIVENDQENKLENKLNSSSQIFGAEPAQAIRTQNQVQNQNIVSCNSDGQSNKILVQPKINDSGIKNKKNFETDSDPYLLAKFLGNNITENNPKFPKSESQRQRWAKDFDLMIRRDKIDADDIAEVIEWCQRDNFWRSNILSGKKLREKYQQLRMKKESR